ncbi:MAG: hypothetical protein ACJAYU_001569 [Bradymonadia bacterium]|jgi:hypothetical protein
MDEGNDTAQAEVVFFHASQTLGAIDVDLDGRTIQVIPGGLSTSTPVEPGPVTLELRNAGALLPLLAQQEIVDLGSNLFVIAGNTTDGSLAAFEVGSNAPDVDRELTAFQVVSTTSVDLQLDIYTREGGQPASIGQYAQTGFVQLSPTLAEVLVYNAGDDPMTSAALLRLRPSQLSFRAGRAYAVLLTGDLSGIDAVSAPVR